MQSAVHTNFDSRLGRDVERSVLVLFCVKQLTRVIQMLKCIKVRYTFIPADQYQCDVYHFNRF